jgi:small nuclear ribonucleoprotein (snRNP)-like protein
MMPTTDLLQSLVKVTTKKNSIYTGVLTKINQKTNRFHLTDLCIFNKDGSFKTSLRRGSGEERRWFNSNSVKQISRE